MCVLLFFITFSSVPPLSFPLLLSLLPSLFLSFPLQMQYDCYTASCHFDGGDSCTLNPLPTNPWANCSQSQVCRQSFKDGVCDVQCNTAKCFYDGGDCQPSCPLKDRCELGINDGQCTAECNTQECPFDQIDCKEKPNFVSCLAGRARSKNYCGKIVTMDSLSLSLSLSLSPSLSLSLSLSPSCHALVAR